MEVKYKILSKSKFFELYSNTTPLTYSYRQYVKDATYTFINHRIISIEKLKANRYGIINEINESYAVFKEELIFINKIKLRKLLEIL